jgi:hypothetical protein
MTNFTGNSTPTTRRGAMPLDEEGHETDQDNNPPEPTENFSDRIPSVLGALRIAGRGDLAEQMSDGVWSPADLMTPEGEGLLAEIEKVPNIGPMVTKDLGQYVTAERAEQERRAKAEAEAERQDLMGKARAKLAAEREKSARAAELARAMQAVKDEEAAAAAAAGNRLPDPMADAELMISRAVDVIDSPHVDLETKATMAHEAIEAFEAAQAGSKQRPVDLDPEQFLKEFNETDGKE